jgi:hypothetical protein
MTDIVMDKMKQAGIPMTRENYLDLAYMGNPPEQLDGEEEANLPEQFQKEREHPADTLAQGNTTS